MRDVFVAGAAMTRFGKFPDRGLRSFAEEAVASALADAEATPDLVEATFFANAAAGLLTGQEMIRGQVALRHTGLLGPPIVNVENACASGATAVHLAWLSVASGAVDIAMAVGAEKLTHADKAKSFRAFNGAIDLDEYSTVPADPGRSPFMDLYAGLACAYMRRSGATVEDYAAVAVKSHANAARNPNAQYRAPVSVDEVLESRLIAQPLTLLMCAPIGDGAAAVVLTSDRGRARVHADPIKIAATVLRSARQDGTSVVATAAREAYSAAGVAPTDVDVVELHDAAAPAELIVSEELGFTEPGGGASLLRSGATALGGSIPINPSGGLLSKGHPIGATGCAQIVELVDQLRGRADGRQVDGASIGLAENAGGWLGDGPAVAAITILARS